MASFFVSRVDTEVDRRLEAIGGDDAASLRTTASPALALGSGTSSTVIEFGPRQTRAFTPGRAACPNIIAYPGAISPASRAAG